MKAPTVPPEESAAHGGTLAATEYFAEDARAFPAKRNLPGTISYSLQAIPTRLRDAVIARATEEGLPRLSFRHVILSLLVAYADGRVSLREAPPAPEAAP
jgi:hypothetical protein